MACEVLKKKHFWHEVWGDRCSRLILLGASFLSWKGPNSSRALKNANQADYSNLAAAHLKEGARWIVHFSESFFWAPSSSSWNRRSTCSSRIEIVEGWRYSAHVSWVDLKPWFAVLDTVEAVTKSSKATVKKREITGVISVRNVVIAERPR